MSLNIDINKILPVKVSGVCPKSAQQIIDFITELQRCQSWEDVPLEFSRLSTDTVIVSVALRSYDPSNSILPSPRANFCHRSHGNGTTLPCCQVSLIDHRLVWDLVGLVGRTLRVELLFETVEQLYLLTVDQL